MKKTSILILTLTVSLFLLSACSSGGGSTAEKSDEIPVILNQAEYVLYQNIFYNNYLDQYDGKETVKEGVFTILQDAFSNVKRYYVWGYLDQTMCCDWEWEFVPKEPDKLPPPGSKIKVSGIYRKADTALDNFWITDANVEILVSYTGEQADLNMRTMCDTLERVQLANLIRKPDTFIGKQYIAYGRIASGSMLEDPYYDGSWAVGYLTSETMPAIGTIVVLRGTYQEGVLAEAKLLGSMK